MSTSKLTEKRRSPRYTPNSQVSVILYRENARPRGCYVSNYSDHGMLLKCMTKEKATRGSALKVGDSASVHYWDRGEPGRSDKVAGQIVRVDENLVAMEYEPAGTPSLGKLLTLLNRKEQETSPENVSMKKRSPPRLKLPDKESTDTQETVAPSASTPLNIEREESSGSSSLHLGLIVLAILGVVGLALYSFSLSSRLEELTQVVNILATENTNQVEATSPVPSDLTERITALEQKQVDISMLLDDTVKKSEFRTAVDSFDTRLEGLQKTPASTATSQSAASTQPATQASVETGTVPIGQSSWIVNLATLSDNAAVDKFIKKANSVGLVVQAEEVAVNDKLMYRLSIPGITSYEEAQKLAATAQTQLGLSQKPWIAKQ